MPKVSVYNLEGQAVGEIELSDAVFGAPVNEALLHQAVVMYLNNQRQGTASTKTRAEVRGGGRKPWRQKGTGRARHGSIRSPIWVGGGVTFGPKPREFPPVFAEKSPSGRHAFSIVRQSAGRQRHRRRRCRVGRAEDEGNGRGARPAVAERKPLIVLADRDRNVELSTRNLPGAGTTQAADMNVYQVLAHDKLVLTKDAVPSWRRRWADASARCVEATAHYREGYRYDGARQILLRGRPQRQQDQIKQAVEEIFNVKVTKVNTMRQIGKIRRQGPDARPHTGN